MAHYTTNFRLLAGVGALALLAVALPGRQAMAAATATSNFTVSATVQATCLISAGNLSFGTYTGSQVDASSTISVTCTNTTPYDVGLSAGTTTGATTSTRKMAGTGGATLNYALYTDSGHLSNWGNIVDTDAVEGTGNGSAQSLTVYGRLPAAQYVTPGAYSDTITATITY